MKPLLTDDQICGIRRMWASGATQKQVAAKYGITQGYVSQIVNGERVDNGMTRRIRPPKNQ